MVGSHDSSGFNQGTFVSKVEWKNELVNGQLIRIVLDTDQAALLAPILDASNDRSGFEGVFARVARVYEPMKGCIVLELQVVAVDNATVHKIRNCFDPPNQMPP